MASTDLTVAILTDGSRVRGKIIAMGLDAYIVHQPATSTVMKLPKLRGTYNRLDGTTKPDHDYNDSYTNDLSREKEAYQRLQGVRGIANCLAINTHGLVFEFYANGDLEDYIKHNSPAPLKQKVSWILQILDAFIACHKRRILVFDIALRNLMLDDDMNIRLIDFANSSLLPLDEDTELVDEDGYTAEIDILHVANVIYSISRWEKFQTDCMSMDEWPVADSFPSISDLPLGNVIAKAWSHHFKTLDELKLAIELAAPMTATTGLDENSSIIQKPVFIIFVLACATLLASQLRPRR